MTERCIAWPAEGDTFLEGTDVYFVGWRDIVKSLSGGQKPALSGEQAEKLVEKGILEVTYRLGGGR